MGMIKSVKECSSSAGFGSAVSAIPHPVYPGKFDVA